LEKNMKRLVLVILVVLALGPCTKADSVTVAVDGILLIPQIGNAEGTGPDNDFTLELEPGHCGPGCLDEVDFVYPSLGFDVGYGGDFLSGFLPVFIWNSSMSFVGCAWESSCSGIAYLGDGVIGSGFMEWTPHAVIMSIDSLTFTFPQVEAPDPGFFMPAPTAVPEPEELLLFMTGMLSLALFRRRSFGTTY
jgi:hypothetical protein